MSVTDRLFALVQQYRAQNGDAALKDATRMVSHLSRQAPDLHSEIRALSAAVDADAAGRIAAASDADAEVQAIATEIAKAQMLSLASVKPALDVACRIGVICATPGAGSSDWAGDSVIAGHAGSGPTPTAFQPTPSPAPPPTPEVAEEARQPAWQNKWVLGGGAGLLLLMAYQQMGGQSQQQPAPPPGSTAPMAPDAPGGQNPAIGPNQPPGAQGPGGPSAGGSNPGAPAAPGGGGAGGQFPALAPVNGPQPILSMQGGQGNFMIAFSVSGVPAMVSLPQGSWDNGPGGIMLSRNPQSSQPDAMGGGLFQIANQNGRPARLMQVQWQQDNLGLGQMCVAFIGNGGQDVDPRGAQMCLLGGQCERAPALGCGRLPGGQ